MDLLMAVLSNRVLKAAAVAVSAAVAVALNSNPACALTDQDDIDTNRPTFMDSPLVVPRGSLQLENGSVYQRFEGRLNYYDIPENEVRLGLTKTTELQLFTPNWVRYQQGTTIQQGVSDLQEIGIKHQFPLTFKNNPILSNVNLAFIGGVTVPTGRSLISGSGIQPSFRAPWTKAFSPKWTVGGMQSLLVVNSGRDCQFQNVMTLYRNIGTRTCLFSEYAGYFTHQAAPNNMVHFGVIRKLTRHQQVDVNFGAGLNNSAPHAFIGAGYSIRLDHIPAISKL